MSRLHQILLASVDLGRAGAFTAEQLVVAAWRADARLGLRGYESDYPDAAKVLVYVMGRRGLVGLGWLQVVGPKLYMLSQSGLAAAALLLAGRKPDRPRLPGPLNAADAIWLVERLESDAARKHAQGLEADIGLREALGFWGCDVADGSAGANRASLRLSAIAGRLGCGHAMPDGRWIGSEEAQSAARLDAWLRQRFLRHLAILDHRREAS